ncbi:MAG: hypothetical protein J6S92_05915, partial [Oscillospiraceae bacterium]|nr:hypothetical protein [Oscillospiraceae bacterium]
VYNQAKADAASSRHQSQGGLTMPALKCISCSRWSFEGGCTLHSYSLMRDCMMDAKDFHKDKTEENVYDLQQSFSNSIHDPVDRADRVPGKQEIAE